MGTIQTGNDVLLSPKITLPNWVLYIDLVQSISKLFIISIFIRTFSDKIWIISNYHIIWKWLLPNKFNLKSKKSSVSEDFQNQTCEIIYHNVCMPWILLSSTPSTTSMLTPNLVPNLVPITSTINRKSFLNFSQRTALALLCSVANLQWINYKNIYR